MRYLVIIALLIGCNEVELKYKNCFDMTIPQGNPVKFWLNGVESFNEKVVPGIQQVCFFQKFNNDDVIKIQIADTDPNAYALRILDENDLVLQQLDFTETSDVFNLSFQPSSYANVINKKVKFQIGTNNLAVVDSDTFTSDLETWTLAGLGGSDWVWDAANGGSMRNVTLNVSGSKVFRRATTLPQEEHTIRITYNPLVSVNSSLLKLVVALADGPNVGDNFFNIESTLLAGSGVTEQVIVTPAYWEDTTHLFVYLSSTGFVAGDNVDFMTLEILTRSFATIASSDYIDIADNEETFLLQYSNESNFAGLDYSAGTIFGVRVHSMFFKERFPEEDESEEISDGSVVKLSGSVKNQKLLQIEPAPFYFHNLLKRVLQHNTIYIDDMYWEKEEGYEMAELNTKYPLHSSEVWLTQKQGGYDTNVYGALTNL